MKYHLFMIILNCQNQTRLFFRISEFKKKKLLKNKNKMNNNSFYSGLIFYFMLVLKNVKRKIKLYKKIK